MKTIYTHRIENDLCIINVIGEVREDLCRHVEECLTHYLKGIVINLNNMEKLNSTAAGILVQIEKKLQSYQVKLALCELSTANLRLFQNTLLGQIINVCMTEKEAIDSILNTPASR